MSDGREKKDAADFGGWEPGMVVEDEGYDPGQVVPRADDTGMPSDTGSQVPPPRDTLGNQLDEDGNPVESIKRVATRDIEAAWSGLALANRVGAMLLARDPESANDWELYDMPGAAEAARELSQALKKAKALLQRKLKALDVDYEPPWSDDEVEAQVGEALGDVYRRVAEPVMKKHSDLGAQDTEPRYVMGQALINAIKDFYGISYNQWTELGDWI